jgi:hypothetical protein
VRRTCRIVLLGLLFAALPLRGYAGVLTALCESHHGGAAVAENHMHEHADSHHHDSDEDAGGPSHAASVCSICASCCAGASLAPDAPRVAVVQSPVSDRIAFFDRRNSGYVPEHLDRPPFAS